jgi:hypothetical protein
VGHDIQNCQGKYLRENPIMYDAEDMYKIERRRGMLLLIL